MLDTDSFLEWFQIIHYWWLFYLAAILPNAIRLSAGLITWHYPFSWTILVLGCSGLAAELTIHCDCDIGLQPRYIECFAGIHASILHGDVLNHQNAANFIHGFTLVYFSSRVRALEVGKKKEVKKQQKWDCFVHPFKVCHLRKAVIHIKIIISPHHWNKYYTRQISRKSSCVSFHYQV